MNPHALFAELSRRRVFRVAAVYAVVAWLVIQIAETTFPYLALPDWTVTLVIVLALLGFPITLVLAWAFDITPEGVVRTEPVEQQGRARAAAGLPPARWGAQRIAAVGGVFLLATAGGAFLLYGGTLQRAFGGEELDRSIAVLPFANLSADPENEYFSDGITEDLLTNLANISDLRVISRTSVVAYKGSGKNARQIAQELGVATILEGTVRRSGNRVRINAQLIDARSDRHLYAEAFDRELTDIFAIQSEIASAIAQALRARLSPEERERIERAPTEDLAAYDYYLRGRSYFFRLTPQDNQTAIALFQHALELDPRFALAHAGLSGAYSWRSIEQGREWTDSALVAARRALALDENLAEAYTALGYAHYRRGEREAALAAYEQAVRRKPNDAFALHGTALIHLQRGRYDAALQGFRRALQVEPNSGLYHYQVGIANAMLDRLSQAGEAHERARQLLPDHPTIERARAYLFLRRGEPARALEAARAALALRPEDPAMIAGSAYYAMVQGDLPTARAYLERARAVAPERREQHSIALGYVYWKQGEREGARELFRQALELAEERRAGGDEGWEPALETAFVHAVQGEKETAYRALEEAVARGFRDFRRALAEPYLENLRGEPRFQRLIGEMQADVERMRARAEQEGW